MGNFYLKCVFFRVLWLIWGQIFVFICLLGCLISCVCSLSSKSRREIVLYCVLVTSVNHVQQSTFCLLTPLCFKYRPSNFFFFHEYHRKQEGSREDFCMLDRDDFLVCKFAPLFSYLVQFFHCCNFKLINILL